MTIRIASISPNLYPRDECKCSPLLWSMLYFPGQRNLDGSILIYRPWKCAEIFALGTQVKEININRADLLFTLHCVVISYIGFISPCLGISQK